MPQLPPVSKTLRIQLFATDGGNARVQDRFFMSYTGAGPTVADLNTLATTIDTAINANFVALQQNQFTWTGITITDLTNTSAAQTSKTISRAGTNAVTPAGAAAALVLKFKTSRRYRGGHPRLYMSGLRNTDYGVPPTWQSATVTAWVSAWNAFITAVSTTPPTNIGTLTQANVSYYQGFTNVTSSSGRTRPKPTLKGTVSAEPIVSVSGNPNVASQRRRNLQSA